MFEILEGVGDPDKNALTGIEMVLSGAEAVTAAIKKREKSQQQTLRNLRACFNKASKDGDSRIPSYLSSAILNACAMVRE